MLDLFRSLFPQVNQPSWQQIAVAVAIIVVGFIVQRYILRPSITGISKFFRKRGRLFIADIIEQFSKAIRRAFMVIIIALSVSVVIEVWLFTHKTVKSLIISIMVYYLYKGIYDVLTFYLINPDRFKTGRDQDILTPYFLRISKVLVMIVALFSIASLWNFNLNGFLTAIGLTGV
ncbi:MAG: mechanosensitive ion channel protein MscS, partial [Lysinibacillus sp.]